MSSPNNPSRLIGGVAVFFVVYAGAYWLYEPSEPPITFGEPPSLATLAAAGVDMPVSSSDGSVFAADSSDVAEDGTGSPEAAGGAVPADEPEVETTLVRTVIPPTFREYVVRKGDNGWAGVSRRAYGTTRHAEAIARANPLVSPERLIPGRTRLRVPVDPANVSGKPATVKVEVPRPASSGTAEVAAGGVGEGERDGATPGENTGLAGPAGKTVEYVVRSGDTLGDIAKRELGDSSLWPRIVELNRGTIRDLKKIKPGTRIVLPVREADPR